MKNKKRILFVTKALWIGGIESALINILRNFDYSSYDVSLLVLKAELNLLDQIPSQCKTIIIDREKVYGNNEKYKYGRLFHLTEASETISLIHRLFMWTVPIIKYIENELYIRYVKNLMANKEYDTVIIYSDVVGELAVKAIRARKYIMYYHHGAMRHVYHDTVAWKKCEEIIAVSNNQAENLKKFFCRHKSKITVIHNLVDITSITSKATENVSEYFDNDFLNIVSVGRVSHEKGMDIAVKVCAEIVNAGYKQVKWMIVGDGPAMEEVKNTIIECEMKEHVILVGMKSNPYPFISNADLYVQPSRFEGYPMTILEALVLGQPVISTDNNGAKEILESSKTGYLCPIDVSEIAATVQKLIENPGELSTLKSNVKNIDFESHNQKALNKLESLL